MSSTGRKEWWSITRSAKGGTTLAVTIQDGNVTSKYAVVTHGVNTKEAAADLRKRANAALDELMEAIR
jgi:hypothetical protein